MESLLYNHTHQKIFVIHLEMGENDMFGFVYVLLRRLLFFLHKNASIVRCWHMHQILVVCVCAAHCVECVLREYKCI